MQHQIIVFFFRFIVLFLAIFLHILPLSAGGKSSIITYYISSSEGSDTNHGHTIERPLRSISAIPESSNIKIFLKTDDVFFEAISGLNNCIIDSYGNGELPIICGFKVLQNVYTWEYDNKNRCWRLDLSENNNFVGMSPPKGLEAVINNVGFIYIPQSDSLLGRNLRRIEDIGEDGDFVVSDKNKSDDINNSFRYLWMRWNGNPALLGHLCFPTYQHGISNLSNCVIRNVSVIGFSRHGMCSLSNCVVDNCKIDMIGGSVQIGQPRWVRYGNGIEIWARKNHYNNIIKNCIVSRTYDCGMTIQSNEKMIPDVRNVRFVNNRLYRCRQAFEHFMNPLNENCNPKYIDCEFSSNICLDMGNNGFNSPEERDANILSYEWKERALKIENNTFYGTPYYCGYIKPVGMSKNKVYIYRNQYINHYHGKQIHPTILADSEVSIEKYKEWSGDDSDIVIIERGSKKDLKLRRRIERKIGYKKPELHLDLILNK